MNTNIDKKQLESILAIDFEQMHELVLEVFQSVNSSTQQLKLLSASSATFQDNKEQISFLAHAARGETANFGLLSLNRLYSNLEDNLASLSYSEITDLTTSITKTLEETKEEYTSNFTLDAK